MNDEVLVYEEFYYSLEKGWELVSHKAMRDVWMAFVMTKEALPFYQLPIFLY